MLMQKHSKISVRNFQSISRARIEGMDREEENAKVTLLTSISIENDLQEQTDCI